MLYSLCYSATIEKKWSICDNFELTAAGYSNTFYFNEGLINDGEPFKACILVAFNY
jgi:hypothetical protein